MTLSFDFPPHSGVMLCGHGSRNKLAVEEFANLSAILKQRLPGVPVEYGYLEFANPVINIGLDKLRARGVKNVLAIPGMLFAAGHAKNDIPSVLNTYAAQHQGFSITYGRDLGIDTRMIRAAGERIGEAEALAPTTLKREQTLLMVVGRGASDPDANSNVAKVMRLIWEGMGFGWAEMAYSGVTFPLVAPALDPDDDIEIQWPTRIHVDELDQTFALERMRGVNASLLGDVIGRLSQIGRAHV